MKNLKNGNSFCPLPLYKYIVVFSMVLLVAFTLVSCGGLVDDVPDGYGNVRVSFGSSRNVTQNDKDAATITVYFNGNQIEKKGDVFESLVESGIRLTITAEAVSGGRIIGKGEESIIVRDGTNDVSMKIYTYDNFVVTVGGKAEGFTNFTDAWNAANGKNATLKMNADATSIAVTLTGGNVTLDLKGHTIRGNGSASVITIDGGTLTLNDSASGGTITGGGGGNTVEGGGVNIANGVFNMTGGTITGNSAQIGGGVDVYGTFNFTGGTISNNAASNGGGISVQGNSTLTISGSALITENTSEVNGAGVYSDGAKVTMHGGTIKNNNSDLLGGGIFMTGGTFIMESGTISGNEASDGGGGLYVGANTATMSGGSISGNITWSGGGGVHIQDGATFTKTGGSVSGNTAIDGKRVELYADSGASYSISLYGAESNLQSSFEINNPF